MNLKEKVQSDMKQALKKKQSVRLEALRFLFSSIRNAEIEKKGENLTEDDVLAVLRKQIKMYQESIEQCMQAKQSDKAEKELIKLEFLKEYLPPPISEKELFNLISKVIVSMKVKGLEDQGLVIKEVQKRTGGSVDNVRIVQVVRECLQQI